MNTLTPDRYVRINSSIKGNPSGTIHERTVTAISNKTKDLGKRLKESGLSCSKLTKLAQDEQKGAKAFDKFGFKEGAKDKRRIAKKILDLKKKVCLLK